LSDVGEWRRPANVGFGLSYVFPILVALLVAQEEQIVVIDSPEAHLHPSAQSQMGQLLAHFAAAGVQILVETHSDHLLNGVRLAVKDKVLGHEGAQIHFFTGATEESHGVISPSLDADGSVSEWPAGFFDQADKDLSRLTGWE
jgi:predicted ATPase